MGMGVSNIQRCISMATSKPRLIVTFEESQYQLISDLASLRGVSKARVLRELFEASEDTLRHVVTVLRAAKRAEGEYLDVIKKDLAAADDEIRPLIEQVIQLFGVHVTDIEKNTH
jgi:hypothetical protein